MTTNLVSSLIALLAGRRLAVLTGAGVSTASGIPDYRGPETRRRARNPIRFADYVSDPEGRRRYWARASIGFRRIARASPNAAHHAIAALARAGRVTRVLTQNVDGLHEATGTPDVVALHGRLSEVCCLACGAIESRDAVQERIFTANPRLSLASAEQAPDGDADLAPELVKGFVVPTCLTCGGVLKPNVVFFGESVPRPRVALGYDAVDRAGALLVAGSSLAVFSGLRFVHRARERGIPVAIVNLGETRADPFASVRLEADVCDVLPALADALVPRDV